MITCTQSALHISIAQTLGCYTLSNISCLELRKLAPKPTETYMNNLRRLFKNSSPKID